MASIPYMARFMGQVMLLTGGAMVPPLLISLTHGEDGAVRGLLLTILALALAGSALLLFKARAKTMYAREGYLVVGLSWALIALVGAFPYYLSGSIPSFTDSLFESISGFSTTGATILTDVEALPMGLLFWRSFTNWIGGMGVLVFLLAISSSGGGRAVYLMRAETPGPAKIKLVPKLKDSAGILYGIYIAMTLAEMLFLLAGGLPLFDSVTLAFSTAGTGGMSIKNASIAYYGSEYVEAVIGVFMILFGINFNIFFLLLLKRFSDAGKNEELRAYLLIIAVSVAIIAGNLLLTSAAGGPLPALRDASFQVVSVLSTTNFFTADYAHWPQLSQIVLLLLMFIGACGGSTSGGLTVSRLLILLKDAQRSIRWMIHPNATQIVRMDGKRLKPEIVGRAHVFLVVYAILFAASLLIISLDDMDLVTSTSAVLACLSNAGPGLGLVGPTGNYAMFSDVSKLILSFDMLAGRLELFPLLMIFSPRVWRSR